MLAITKMYQDFPAGHRQPKHDGHCRFVHGHNYDFELTICAHHRDDNGFVFDFGKMQEMKAILAKQFDHTLLIAQDDPELSLFEDMNLRGVCDLRVMQGTSAEHIAEWVYHQANEMLQIITNKRVWVRQVQVWEDRKNTAIYSQ